MSSPNALFHKAWALVRLDADTVEVGPWPAELEALGPACGGAAAGALLLARHPGSLVLACGPLSGAAAPGSGLLTATCADDAGAPVHVPLLLRHGPALKAAGVDFLVLSGRAAQPALLLAEHRGIRLEPARDLEGTDNFVLRSRLRSRLPDARPSLLLGGPAARRGLACAAAGLEAGQSLDRGVLARWLARNNVLAVVLAGGGGLPGSASLDSPLFASVTPHAGPAGFAEVLGWFGPGSAVGSTPGRAAACHLCPRPCLAYLPAGPGDCAILCADHAGYAALAAALGNGAAAALRACSRFGFDARALAPALAAQPDQDPDALCAAWVAGRASLPELAATPAGAPAPCAPQPGARERLAAGLVLGICPILMQRCADVSPDLWTADLGAGAKDALAAAVAAAGLAAPGQDA